MERSENKKMKYDSLSSSSSDESFMTGNDSSDYNDRAKFGGAYMLQNFVRNESTVIDRAISFPESFDLESPQRSDFSASYARSVLTSTWLETQDLQENQKLQSSPAIQSQISKIGMMISSFAENSQHELKVLSNLIQTHCGSTEQKPTSSGMDKLENEHLPITGSKTILDENESQTISLEDIVTVPITFGTIRNNNGFDDLNENSLNFDEIVNPMFDPNVANANITISNVDEVDKGNASVSAPNSVIPSQNTNAQVQPDATFDVNPHQTSTKQIQLPMRSIPQFEAVEIMLDEEDVESEKGKLPLADGLVESLRPLSNEAEPKYMNRAIEILFDQDFFLETVCWQTAKNRINIRGSYILGCWKKSFEEVYGADDEKDARFMSHFRRYKSAKRAAGKASGKTKMVDSKK